MCLHGVVDAWKVPSEKSLVVGNIPLPIADYERYQFSCKALMDDQHIGPLLKDPHRGNEQRFYDPSNLEAVCW